MTRNGKTHGKETVEQDTNRSRTKVAPSPTLPMSGDSSLGLLACSLLPWKQLHQLDGLPRLAKVGVVISIVVAILSVLTNPGLRDGRFGRVCRAASRIWANIPCQTQNSVYGVHDTSSSNDGEWRQPSEHVWRQFGTERCTIERVSVLDLSPERFEAEYRYKKSVLVTFPNGAADWTTPGDWSRRGLNESYSHWGIHSGQSLEIVRKGGNANHVSTFEDYVKNFLMVARADNDTSEPKHYACDRQFFWNSRLGSGLKLPVYFQINRTSDESIFFLGPSLSGVVFHKHSDTWNGVVYGYKRWFLYPNTASPPGGIYHGYSLLNWVKHVYPSLAEQDKPQECVQYPGEILYLAEGTYHATLNLGDTVAVALQRRDATIKTELLAYETTKLTNFLQTVEKPEPGNSFNKRLLEIYKEWHQLLPDNSEAVFKLGSILSDMGDHSEAIPWYRKAIEMDCYFIMAYLRLGTALTELRQYREAESTFLTAISLSPELWDNYKEYGEFLLKMGRHQDALPIFKKGTELMPHMIPFWFYYKLCQVHVGDLEGAKATEAVITEIKAREQN